MFIQVLRHTPFWVWTVLALLIALGLAQTRTRQVSQKRATIVPLLFVIFSASGVAGSFGHGPALIEWFVGVALAMTLAGSIVAVRGAEWSPSTRQFTVPGSFIPLMLMVGVFLLRYAVGIALAFDPERAHDATFAGVCALAYGGFAGLFWARARSLRQSARAQGFSLEPTVRGA